MAVLVVLARLWLVFHRLYDPDELEHLHAGFCVWQGMVPYRDFFEQHGPVLWYLSLPLFAIWGASLKVLFAGRLIIWLIGAATIGLTWHLGNKLYGRWAGPIAALLLLLLPAFQEKNIEWRPDNVAVPLVLVATWAASGPAGPRAAWRSGLFGATLAAGFFCTQKIAYIGLGLAAGFVADLLVRARGGSANLQSGGTSVTASRAWADGLLQVAAAAGGGMLVVAGVLLCFAAQGAMGPFLEMTIFVPLRWKTHQPMLRYVIQMFYESPVCVGAAAAGFVLGLAGVRDSLGRRPGELVVVTGVMGHVAGLVFVPAAFLQYYLPLLPLAALLAARSLLELAGWFVSASPRGVQLGALLVGLAASAAALVLGSSFSPFSAGWSAVIAVACAASILIGVVARRLAVIGLLAATLAAAAPSLATQFGPWSAIQRGQRQRIERLMQATGPDDRIFDGFTGYAALRPHAFFYYWINDHSWPMLSDAERDSGVLEALADPRTRVVLYDQYLRRLLPGAAQRYIVRNFVPDVATSDNIVVVFVRRGRELSPAVPAPDSGTEGIAP